MSLAAAFDTLKFAKRLKEVGVPEPQAEVQAELLAEALAERLASKEDLARTETVMKTDLVRVETAIRTDMEARSGGVFILAFGAVVMPRFCWRSGIGL